MNAAFTHILFRRPVPSDRIFFLGLLLLAAGPAATAQPTPVEIRSGAGPTVRAQPGALLTLPVQFVNAADRRIDVLPSTDVPGGWRRVADPTRLTLFPGGNDLQLLILSVPRQARAQEHRVTVRATVDGDTVQARFEFRVMVERSVSVETILLDAPRTIVAGTTAEFVYQVSNRGNDTARVSFNARSSRGYLPSVAPRAGRLPPGANARIKVSLPSDAGERLKASHMLEFTTTLLPEGTDQRITTPSDVVPRSPVAELKKHELPLFATVRTTNESGRSAIQGEIVGGGSVFAGSGDRLNFIFRGPETQTVSVLGLRDEYRVDYSIGGSSFTVGDDSYALTPLTDLGRTAVGARVENRFGRARGGAYVNQTRYSGPVGRQAAGWFRYPVTSDIEAGVNYLHRNDRILADLFTLAASGRAFRSARFDIEAGRSTGSRGADHALMMQLRGLEPWMSYDLRFVNAGPDYGGYYRGVRFSSINLAGRTDRDVRLEFSARDEYRTPEVDTTFGKIPRSTFIQTGVGYTNLITVSYRTATMSDPISASPFDRRQDIIELRSALDLNLLFLTASAEFGSERDRAVHTVAPTRRVQSSLSFRPSPGQTYTLSADLERSPDATTGIVAERVSANLMASYVIFERTMANVSMFGSRLTGPSAQSYAMFETSLEHVFPSSHRLRFQGRQSVTSGLEPEMAVALEYSIPLGIPLGTDRSSGLVRGRVLERGERGVPGALIMLGSFAAITDDQGRFAFNDLGPGYYTLSLDRASVGIDKVSSIALPLDVNVRGGSATPVTITLVRGATLHGQVRIFEGSNVVESDSAALTERPVSDRGLVAISLTNGSETLRRVSDERGRFNFSDLRPGRWTMRVDPLDLPENLRIATPETTVDIAEGASVTVEVRLLPRRRSIRLIQQGGVLAPQMPDDTLDEIFQTYLIRRATQGEGFVVQVSSWPGAVQAQKEMARVQPLAGRRRVWIEVKSLPRRGTFHRVLVGPFPNRETARAWCRSAG